MADVVATLVGTRLFFFLMPSGMFLNAYCCNLLLATSPTLTHRQSCQLFWKTTCQISGEINHTSLILAWPNLKTGKKVHKHFKCNFFFFTMRQCCHHVRKVKVILSLCTFGQTSYYMHLHFSSRVCILISKI